MLRLGIGLGNFELIWVETIEGKLMKKIKTLIGCIAFVIVVASSAPTNGQNINNDIWLGWGDLSPDNAAVLDVGTQYDYGVWVDVMNLRGRFLDAKLETYVEQYVNIGNDEYEWQIMPGSIDGHTVFLIPARGSDELEVDSAVTFGEAGSYRVTAKVSYKFLYDPLWLEAKTRTYYFVVID